MNVYLCGANDRTTHVELVGFDIAKRRMFIENGRRIAPGDIADRWQPLTLQVHGLRRKGAVLQDVYMASSFVGTNLFVSERCRAAIEDRFEGQCMFLPVTLNPGGVRFFALWVNLLLDNALDTPRCELTEDRFGTKHLSRYAFQERSLAGVGIFRLSPAFAGMWDLVTELFVEMIDSEALEGFSFWNRGAGTEVLGAQGPTNA